MTTLRADRDGSLLVVNARNPNLLTGSHAQAGRDHPRGTGPRQSPQSGEALMIPKTTGRVVADAPGPEDTHCQVVWFGPPQDGQHRKIFEGPVEPIENYAEVLGWAHEMASQMTYSLFVIPLTGAEALRTKRMKDAVANLTDQQRGELRQEVVATLTAVMRDSDDPAVRADAYAILKDMKVIKDGDR